MKKIVGILGLLLFVGCGKGDKGDPGAPGATGPAGATGPSATNFIVNKSGPVNSDSIAVTVPGLNLSRGDILNVYTCIGTACVQVNLYQATTGNNMAYIAQGETVTILNAQTGSQTLWYVTALEKI